ncbi:hypothetical protein DPMN_144134 [Dreissena polymorpha]|uniref:Uncharacterized protein n=1 Tax=Dreissena polymorpha TaxID=45954 RepID=A0A9D4GHJ1_DREPO|nr:hypothetical protein DPMN_144134 [Dreissena polymorpha]
MRSPDRASVSELNSPEASSRSPMRAGDRNFTPEGPSQIFTMMGGNLAQHP